MSTATLTYQGSIVVTTCWCGIRHGVPKELYDYVQQQHNNGIKQLGIHCPLGHSWIFSGKGEAERLRDEKATLERRLQWARESDQRNRDRAAAAERQASAYKGVATKARKRAAAALCPCCNRSFVQLRRHLEAKHPDYTGAVE